MSYSKQKLSQLLQNLQVATTQQPAPTIPALENTETQESNQSDISRMAYDGPAKAPHQGGGYGQTL